MHVSRTAILAAGLALLATQADASIVGADQAEATKPVVTGAASASMLPSVPSLIADDKTEGLVSTVLYDGTTLFTGVTFTRLEFVIPSAGQLDVLFQDMKFPAGPAGVLSFALVDGDTVLGLIKGSGALSYTVDGPTTVFAYIYGVAGPASNVGSYYLSAVHEELAPVPLPATVWLLLSGFGLFVGLGRRRAQPGLLSALPA